MSSYLKEQGAEDMWPLIEERLVFLFSNNPIDVLPSAEHIDPQLGDRLTLLTGNVVSIDIVPLPSRMTFEKMEFDYTNIIPGLSPKYTMAQIDMSMKLWALATRYCTVLGKNIPMGFWGGLEGLIQGLLYSAIKRNRFDLEMYDALLDIPKVGLISYGHKTDRQRVAILCRP